MKNDSSAAGREERILVCLSASPSNQKVIEAAAKMALAFRATFNAIYVKSSDFDTLPEEDAARLRSNILFAEQCGATVTTIVGHDISLQIAEFAHLSGTTKLVVGRSAIGRAHFWSRSSLTEQIILNAPDIDVYIIPDSTADLKYRNDRYRSSGRIRPTLRDSILTLLLLSASTVVGLLFTRFGFSEANIITVYILGVLIVSVLTVSPVCSAMSSLASVLLFNYFFIEPKFSFHTYETEYLVTFAIMLASSLITGSLANRLKESAGHYAHEAFRAKVLFDTNQMLQKAKDPDDVIRITAKQVITLLDRDLIIYPLNAEKALSEGLVFTAVHSLDELPFEPEKEREVADWVFKNHQTAGTGTDHFKDAEALYHAISINGYCYGVIGIRLGKKLLETFEYSVFMSILGECALSLESLRNAQEKEQAAVLAHNEQLRANLLRSISHDIRTPLTTISGNASNLLAHYEQLDSSSRRQIFTDIYDDSQWLINLVENLLSISRIENGRMDLHLSLNVISDVIEEALKHVDRNIKEHTLRVVDSGEVLLAKIDPGLISQVLINLINNAVKNTPAGSEIVVSTAREGAAVKVSVSDNGPGITDDMKPHIFEMFYTGMNRVADGRRGLGLGLSLCKSIIEAHGGKITLEDNTPSGCRFTFILPAEEVILHE